MESVQTLGDFKLHAVRYELHENLSFVFISLWHNFM